MKLYTKINSEVEASDKMKIKISLNGSHAIFKGHFPGMPVLPGASMVEILRALLESERSEKLVFTQAYNIKFISLIQPDKNPEITFDIQTKQQEKNLDVNTVIYAGDKVSMKFSGTYQIL